MSKMGFSFSRNEASLLSVQFRGFLGWLSPFQRRSRKTLPSFDGWVEVHIFQRNKKIAYSQRKLTCLFSSVSVRGPSEILGANESVRATV